MALSSSERLTNRQNGRSTSACGPPEHVAQVRTHRTAPLDQSVADPSSLPASRLRDRMNQRTPCASTGEFFNTIRQQQSFELWLRSIIGSRRNRKNTRRPFSPRTKLYLAIEEHFTRGGSIACASQS